MYSPNNWLLFGAGRVEAARWCFENECASDGGGGGGDDYGIRWAAHGPRSMPASTGTPLSPVDLCVQMRSSGDGWAVVGVY